MVYGVLHLSSWRPGPPQQWPVDNALSLTRPAFDALWSADFQVQGHEPTKWQSRVSLKAQLLL